MESSLVLPQEYGSGKYTGIFRFRFFRFGKWVEVLVDGCALQFPMERWNVETFMSDSGKFGTYCFGLTGREPVFGSIRECAESAVRGKVMLEVKPWWK